jgi:hypothetical protein
LPKRKQNFFSTRDGKSFLRAGEIDFLNCFSLDMPYGNTVIRTCNGFPWEKAHKAFVFKATDDQHLDAVSLRGTVKR